MKLMALKTDWSVAFGGWSNRFTRFCESNKNMSQS